MRFLQSTDPTTGVTTWFEFGHADRLECHAQADMPGKPERHLYAVTLLDKASMPMDEALESAYRKRGSIDVAYTLEFIRTKGLEAYETEITRAGLRGIVLAVSPEP